MLGALESDVLSITLQNMAFNASWIAANSVYNWRNARL
jgi:hypothetical protein